MFSESLRNSGSKSRGAGPGRSCLMRAAGDGRLCLVFLILAVLLAASGTGGAQIAWRLKYPAQGLTVGINPLNSSVLIAEEEFEGDSSGLSISYDRGQTWSPWGFSGLGGVRQIFVHPVDTNVVLCAANGSSLRRTSDYGATWATVLSNFGIDGESISADPNHPDTIFAGNFQNGAVYRSTDRGATWTIMGISSNALCALAIRPDSTNILYAGTGGGTISRSTDYGVSWEIVKPGTAGGAFQEIPRIVVNSADPMILYASTYGAVPATLDVWKSTNGGVSWFRTALQGFPNWALEIHPTDPDIVYAGSFTASVAAVMKSTDGGDTWETTANGFPDNSFMWTLKIHPLDPDFVVTAATLGFFGANGIFRLVKAVGSIRGAFLDDVSLDTIRNGVARNLLNGDASVLTEARPLYELGFYEGDPVDFTNFLFTAYPYYAQYRINVFPPTDTVYADAIMTELAKASLTGTVVDSATSLGVEARVKLDIYRSIGDTVLVDTTDGIGAFDFADLYVSEDSVNGINRLTVIPDLPFSSVSTGVITLSVDTALILPVVVADVLLISAFDGSALVSYYAEALASLPARYALWDVQESGPAPMSRGVEFGRNIVLYYSGNHLDSMPAADLDSLRAALSAGVSIFLTGQNIVEKNETHPLFASDIGIGFGGNSGVAFHTGTTGGPFEGLGVFSTGSGAANQTSRDIIASLHPDAIQAMTYGAASGPTSAIRRDSVGSGARALVMGFGFEAIHSIALRAEVMARAIGYLDGTLLNAFDPAEIPAGFRLHQNYPNPFNPSTVIRYDLPVRSDVVIIISDLLGRKIVVREGVEDRGSHAFQWNPDLANGVYFLRLTAEPVDRQAGSGRFSAVNKMILLR